MRSILRLCITFASIAFSTSALAQYYGGNGTYGSQSSRSSGYSTPSMPRSPMPSYGTGSNWNSNSVGGYTKRDGTYVAPHRRSNPDSSLNNNWSTKGNSNPYTGATGTKRGNPYGW